MTVRRISGGTKTVGSLNTSLPQAFHPGWDEQPGLAQAHEHVKRREAMGKKKTPKGPGVMRKK